MPTVSQLVSKVGIDTSDVTSGLQSFSQLMVQGVGTATQQAQLRIDALSDRITFQKRQLDILGTSLIETAKKHGDNSIQVQRAQLNYDRLASSIQQSEKQLPNLRRRLEEVDEQTRRAGNAGEQFSQSFKQGMVGIVGPAAVATASIQLLERAISGTIEAVGDALALREQQNSLRAVTGSIAGYTEALTTAKEQQLLFGGTIRENIDGVQGLAITAKETGASLADLIDLSQRLTLKSPEQGAAGARIALVEALSEGNIRSLRQRFEIPAAALAKLKDQSLSVEERMQALSGYLDRVGLSSETVAGRVDEDAAAFRRLNQELEVSTLRLGDELATALGGAATGLARLFGLINENPKAIAELRSLPIFGGSGTVNQEDIDRAARDVRAGGVIGGIDSARQARETEAGLGGVLGFGDAGAALAEQTAAIEAARARLLLLGVSSDDMRDRVNGLLRTFGETGDITAFTKGLRDLEGQANHGSKAIRDLAGATKELTDEERERLEKQRDQTGDRASDAFARMRALETDYQRERGDRLSEHQRKLADIQSDGNKRLAEIDARYQEQRADADQSFLDKRADIQQDLTRKLTDLEGDYTRDSVRMRSDAAERLLQIDTSLTERLVDLRRASAERIAEMEGQASEQAEARTEAWAERARASAERRAELEQQLTQRLADFDGQQLDRRQAAQEQYQDRLESLAERRADQEAQAQAQAADRQQAYQDRLADMAEASADRSEDRATRHADRLEDIQRRAEGGTEQGRITRLTGETFTTEFASSAGGGGDTARLLAEEEERYRIEEERARRDEQRARDKMERDRQRQEQAAQERLAGIQAQYQEELAAADAAYVAQQAKADEKAARDRARLEEAGAAQIAALEAQAARAEEQAAKQEAKEDEKRQRQIEKERASLAAREADAIADADKQRERLSADLASDLATRDAAYQQQRTDAQTHAAEQLSDAEAAYVAQLTKLQESHAAQRTEAETATADRLTQEADSFVRQDEQRAAAYARQLDTLKTALGEQLSEYTRIQLELGDITQREADRRQAIIEAQYLAQAKAQQEAFDSFFGGTYGFGSKETPDRQPGGSGSAMLPPERDDWRLNSGPAPGGVMIGSLTVNGVQDAQSFLVELRRLVVNEVRANGGDADAYWGGT
jgi:hypothetical protein